jgi:4-hydroxyphenylacetate 3-monooxygenase
MYPKMFVRMCEIIQILGAGGLVAVPSYAELDGPATADVTSYFQRRTPAPRRASNCSGWLSMLGCHSFRAASSSTSATTRATWPAGTLYGLYDRDTHIERIL